MGILIGYTNLIHPISSFYPPPPSPSRAKPMLKGISDRNSSGNYLTMVSVKVSAYYQNLQNMPNIANWVNRLNMEIKILKVLALPQLSLLAVFSRIEGTGRNSSSTYWQMFIYWLSKTFNQCLWQSNQYKRVTDICQSIDLASINTYSLTFSNE